MWNTSATAFGISIQPSVVRLTLLYIRYRILNVQHTLFAGISIQSPIESMESNF
jgi:hypothetical protein